MRIFLVLMVGILSFISTYLIGSEKYFDLSIHQGMVLIVSIPVLLIILSTTIYYLYGKKE